MTHRIQHRARILAVVRNLRKKSTCSKTFQWQSVKKQVGKYKGNNREWIVTTGSRLLMATRKRNASTLWIPTLSYHLFLFLVLAPLFSLFWIFFLSSHLEIIRFSLLTYISFFCFLVERTRSQLFTRVELPLLCWSFTKGMGNKETTPMRTFFSVQLKFHTNHNVNRGKFAINLCFKFVFKCLNNKAIVTLNDRVNN